MQPDISNAGLTAHQIRLCQREDVDPNLISQIDDNNVYSASDLMQLLKCSYPTARKAMDGIPYHGIGRPIRVKGHRLKEAIFSRLQAGLRPFN